MPAAEHAGAQSVDGTRSPRALLEHAQLVARAYVADDLEAFDSALGELEQETRLIRLTVTAYPNASRSGKR